MKIKLSEKDVKKLIESGSIEGIDKSEPWWVIALKVAAYLIGLILAGYVTPDAVGCIVSSPLFNI